MARSSPGRASLSWRPSWSPEPPGQPSGAEPRSEVAGALRCRCPPPTSLNMAHLFQNSHFSAGLLGAWVTGRPSYNRLRFGRPRNHNRLWLTAPVTQTPSAGSGDLLGHDETGLMGAAVGIGDAVGELGDGEEAVGFDDATFAVGPGRFDGVEPGALDRQIAGNDADAAATLLDLAIVVT